MIQVNESIPCSETTIVIPNSIIFVNLPSHFKVLKHVLHTGGSNIVDIGGGNIVDNIVDIT